MTSHHFLQRPHLDFGSCVDHRLAAEHRVQVPTRAWEKTWHIDSLAAAVSDMGAIEMGIAMGIAMGQLNPIWVISSRIDNNDGNYYGIE